MAPDELNMHCLADEARCFRYSAHVHSGKAPNWFAQLTS